MNFGLFPLARARLHSLPCAKPNGRQKPAFAAAPALTVKNTGTGVAPSVTVTSSTLGSASGATLPATLGDVQPDQAASVTLTFPASAGADHTATPARIAGTYTGGTFGGTLRTTLP